MQSYRTWFWSCHCWHKTHVLFGDSCCIHLYSRCIHLYRRWFMVCLFGIIFFDMPTIWAFTLTFLDTALPSLKHQKPKSSCLILLHILFSFTLFHTFFFICFHNNNQLTFYFLSYYLTKDSSSGPECRRKAFMVFIHTSISYFVITLSWLLAFTISKSKHKREHKQRFWWVTHE